ncbi:bifunctional tetrahydrofolate synthase/dihydrofolate synthase [Thiohalophilus thiocyanatoxydans]|uniref:Dihydrofolate synthase/folylpolyglutamate synthase n=1 Tax=Thiohalophilus thiocyanatoxydans TaxID=381308 RepID=A0A4R8IRB6_9GAMM|nr:bifunctional tetrahydrofolate synthase/dihydrofolate synthase [Thiohalophilus thiocyanatoxydans]TDY00039.1 dihydrofolate synthase/folylpolyglutamate synthase [Thiohalophilus thiocyanatoxydans]
MRFETLSEWLQWQESLHPEEIELGLARVGEVFARLCPEPLPFTVVTVAGTNGKGSSIAALEAMLRVGGYRVGAYTSPHLLRYNERIRLDGEEVSDTALVEAFARVDQARDDISLTYFEFGTLAALRIFADVQPDIVLLEVGLGGRLDAVNIIDPDVALITAVGIDHTAWLGADRETIAGEKAGIMRPGGPVVCSDPLPPAAIVDRADKLGAPLYQLGCEFDYQLSGASWRWHCRAPTVSELAGLPRPLLGGEHQYRNIAGALMVLALLQADFPLERGQIDAGLARMQLPGRLQLIPGEVPLLLDVAHNPDGVAQLAAALRAEPVAGRNRAIVGMMADKDLRGALTPLLPLIDGWFPVDLSAVPRAASAARLADLLKELGAGAVTPCSNLSQALQQARAVAVPGDRIVVFGSFYTVAQALAEPL